MQAKHFIQNHRGRERIIKETIIKIQNIKPYKRHFADLYVQIMNQILKDGEVYVDTEITRIDKILLSAISTEKQDELTKQRNVLQSFRNHQRDEL